MKETVYSLAYDQGRQFGFMLGLGIGVLVGGGAVLIGWCIGKVI